jgi:hypothetical protein
VDDVHFDTCGAKLVMSEVLLLTHPTSRSFPLDEHHPAGLGIESVWKTISAGSDDLLNQPSIRLGELPVSLLEFGLRLLTI